MDVLYEKSIVEFTSFSDMIILTTCATGECGISNGIYAQNINGVFHCFVNIVKVNKCVLIQFRIVVKKQYWMGELKGEKNNWNYHYNYYNHNVSWLFKCKEGC